MKLAGRSLLTFLILALPILALLLLDPGSSGASEDKTSPAAPVLNELEQTFMATLTNATLEGYWRLADAGGIGDEKTEKYVVTSVRKIHGDRWLIWARIQYGSKDVNIPVPVAVKWAGDTPVISVTNAGLPGLGTYTARVMVYRNLYTGTWFGSDHGGMLSGTITKNAAAGTKSAAADASNDAARSPAPSAE